MLHQQFYTNTFLFKRRNNKFLLTCRPHKTQYREQPPFSHPEGQMSRHASPDRGSFSSGHEPVGCDFADMAGSITPGTRN